ncbi:hypothetical protein [Paracoccus sp. (in: a-proteobacteria)]|uniref:hypothetical protein n=1 Tax=Paracoccus sp. TaxID=267 RepID=UPI003A8BDE05
MIELIFVTCLSAAPASCQDRSLLFADEMGLMTCMVRGQAEIARWLDRHPRERVRAWTCRVPRQDGVSI